MIYKVLMHGRLTADRTRTERRAITHRRRDRMRAMFGHAPGVPATLLATCVLTSCALQQPAPGVGSGGRGAFDANAREAPSLVVEPITVSEVKGSATLQSGSSRAPLRVDSVVEEGQPIQVAPGSRVRLKLGKRALFELGPNARLIVYQLPISGVAASRATWLRLERGYLHVIWTRTQDEHRWPLDVSFSHWSAKLEAGEYFFDSAASAASVCVAQGGLQMSGVPEFTPQTMDEPCASLRAAQPPKLIALQDRDWDSLRGRRALAPTLKKAAAAEAARSVAELRRRVSVAPPRPVPQEPAPPAAEPAAVVQSPPPVPPATPPSVPTPTPTTVPTQISATLVEPAPAPAPAPPPPLPAPEPQVPSPMPATQATEVLIVTPMEAPPSEPAIGGTHENPSHEIPVATLPTEEVPAEPLIPDDATVVMVDPAVTVAPTPEVMPAPEAGVTSDDWAWRERLPPKSLRMDDALSRDQGDAQTLQPAMPEMTAPTSEVTASGSSNSPDKTAAALSPSHLASLMTPSASPGPNSGEWIVNVASHTSPTVADAQARELSAQGFPATVRAETVHELPAYRVVIDGVPTESAAMTMLKELDSRFGLLSSWVLRKR